jgi:uncharacterized protein YkwD
VYDWSSLRPYFQLTVLLCACGSGQKSDVQDVHVVSPGVVSEDTPDCVQASQGGNTGGDDSLAYTFTATPSEQYSTRYEASESTFETDVLKRDGRLDRVARTVMEIEAEGIPVTDQVLSEALWWHGCPQVSHAVAVFVGSDEHKLTSDVAGWLHGRSKMFANRFGFAKGESSQGQIIVSVSGHSRLELKPVPRRISVSEDLQIVGKISTEFKRVSVVVTSPKGIVVEHAVKRKGRRFEGTFRPDTSGKWQVEIIGDGPLGPTGLANFPVVAGTGFCKTIAIYKFEVESTDHSILSRILFKEVNRERKSAGLGKIKWSQRLADVAREYAQEMGQSGIVAHVSPLSGSVADRILAAGISLAGVAENLALAPTAIEAHIGLMRSPAHRANILHGRADGIGIGVFVDRSDADLSLYVVQVFSIKSDFEAREVTSGSLIEMINDRRKNSGFERVKENSWLNQAAQQAGDFCFGGDGAPTRLKGSPFVGVSALRLETNNLESVLAAIQKEFSDKDTDMGVAIVRDDNSESSKGLYCVMILLGRR